MNNPFRLFWLMFKTRRPSRIQEIKAVKEGFWLKKKYGAMMFFGHILTHTQHEADILNAHGGSLKRHEAIHLKQAQSTCNSWLCFYIIYIWHYLRALPQNRYMRNAAYYLNPFEMEAYEHMYESDYLDKCHDGANGWRKYAKMKPSQRRKMSKS